MTITVDFPAETEKQLQQRAAATGQDVASLIRQIVVDALTDTAADPPRERVDRQSEQFRQHLEALIALHSPSQHVVDDSRESIYAGRGE